MWICWIEQELQHISLNNLIIMQKQININNCIFQLPLKHLKGVESWPLSPLYSTPGAIRVKCLAQGHSDRWFISPCWLRYSNQQSFSYWPNALTMRLPATFYPSVNIKWLVVQVDVWSYQMFPLITNKREDFLEHGEKGTERALRGTAEWVVGLFLLLSVVMDPQHNALGSNNTEILK